MSLQLKPTTRCPPFLMFSLVKAWGFTENKDTAPTATTTQIRIPTPHIPTTVPPSPPQVYRPHRRILHQRAELETIDLLRRPSPKWHKAAKTRSRKSSTTAGTRPLPRPLQFQARAPRRTSTPQYQTTSTEAAAAEGELAWNTNAIWVAHRWEADEAIEAVLSARVSIRQSCSGRRRMSFWDCVRGRGSFSILRSFVSITH